MQSQLNQPLRDSFNNFQIQNYKLITFLSDITIKKRGHYPMMKLMEQACPEQICDSVIKSYRKQFKKQIYQIEITLHSRCWLIKKRLEDFVELEKKLKDKYKKKIPHMPVKKESEQDNFGLLEDFFVLFLESACQIQSAHDDLDLLLFLQIPILYNRKRVRTYLQTYSKKRSGGRFNEYNCRRCIALFTNWKKRFFTISTEGIFYSPGHTQEQSTIKQMLLFSYDFSMTYGLNETGYKWGINLHGCQRILHIKANNWYEFCLFILAIKLSLKQNGYLENNRFQSFAPPRESCDSKYYIDGEHYFKAIYDEMLNAKSEIFITGWMLTPYYILCRPNHIESEYRFDKLLQKVATKGIKVYIIVFLEPKLALNNDSQYTKYYLESLHPNIKVLRHPPFVVIPFLWSHHQKIVIVDQRIGFIGGLDICYGRYDNNNHKLSDQDSQIKYWQGADYCNLRISDVYTPRQYEVSLINRNYDPRLPWHDVAVQLRGDSVIDLSRHFIQYWNFVNFQTKFDERELLIQVGIVLPEHKQEEEMLEEANEKKEKVEEGREKLREDIRKLEPVRLSSHNYKKQQVLQEPVPPDLKTKRSISEGFHLITQIVDKKLVRQISAKYDLKLDPNLHHLQQIIATDEKEKDFYRNYLKLEQQRHPGKNDKKKIEDIVEKKFDKLKKDLKPLNPFTDQQPVDSDIVLAGSKTITKGNMKHQLLRSSSYWSLGLKQGFQQRSIYNSLISMISKAQHYIYIETQFFICVQNHVSQALRQRIELAYKNNQKFKVIIVLPLLPAFEGEVDSNSSTVLKVQLHWQFQTICRGGRSLLERLAHIENLDEYIQFYSLRTHGIIAKRPVTEIIYVHSKLIIVDDKVMLIGSANINDRSLLGTRDSEIGVIIEDKDDIEIIRGGETVNVKKFPYSLRVQLFQQHFGLSAKQASDLMYDDDVWYMVKERANKNTAVYREIFAPYPDDNVKNLTDLPEFVKKRDLHKYEVLKECIKGNVVEFPKDFLLYENLKPRPNQKEYYVPEISFT